MITRKFLYKAVKLIVTAPVTWTTQFRFTNEPLQKQVHTLYLSIKIHTNTELCVSFFNSTVLET